MCVNSFRPRSISLGRGLPEPPRRVDAARRLGPHSIDCQRAGDLESGSAGIPGLPVVAIMLNLLDSTFAEAGSDCADTPCGQESGVGGLT